MSLRKRVQEIRDSDPDFFANMLEWKEEFDIRRKGWWDKAYVQNQRDLISGKLVKKRFTVDDALDRMWKSYLDDEDWGLVLA